MFSVKTYLLSLCKLNSIFHNEQRTTAVGKVGNESQISRQTLANEHQEQKVLYTQVVVNGLEDLSLNVGCFIDR